MLRSLINFFKLFAKCSHKYNSLKLSSSGREFQKQLLLNLMDHLPNELRVYIQDEDGL